MIKELLGRLKQSNNFRSLSLLVSGSVIAQIISLIASPIMTRLYTTDVIGEYTLLLTSVGLFGSVICARFDMAIVSEADEKKVVPLMALSFYISTWLSIIVSILFGIYYLINDYSYGQTLFYTISIFTLLFLTGITNILFSYNNRCCDYKIMTYVNIVRALVKEIPMVVCGFIWPKTFVLIISHILGTVFGLEKQNKSLTDNNLSYKSLFSSSKKEMILVAKENKKQALYATPSLFANNFSYSSLNLYIQYLFGSSILGLYSISFRLLGLPLNIISGNVGRIYLEQASNMYNKGYNYNTIFKKTSLLLFVLAIPMVLILMLFSPSICEYCFGKEYYVSGQYVRYLAPMFGVKFIVSPLNMGMQISKKQDIEFLFQILFIICSILSFAICKIQSLDIDSFLISISASFTVIYIIIYIYLYKLSFKRFNA